MKQENIINKKKGVTKMKDKLLIGNNARCGKTISLEMIAKKKGYKVIKKEDLNKRRNKKLLGLQINE